MEKVTRPYYKNKRLILGSGKSQKGGFFPISCSVSSTYWRGYWKNIRER